MALEYFPDSVLSIPVDLNAPYFDPGYHISNESLSPTTRHILARRNGDRTKVGINGGDGSAAAKEEAKVAGDVLSGGDTPSSEKARGRLRRLLSRG